MTQARRIPIQKYMTRAQYFAAPDESVITAYERMLEHDVRHLPVLRAEQLVGVLFKSDLKLVEALSREVLRPVQVQSVMVTEYYTVGPDEALDVAAREMSKRKWGSALVLDQGKVVGVFTTTDALRALSDSLTDSLPESMREAT
ncbi:MAG TPA: CBS domain-containing protein [Polyangiaceae bacterium]|nr:CBS domain-containing protein [Polyangiaceae bacterium]